MSGQREYHKGLDLVGIDDSSVYAIADGEVRVLYEANGFGRYIRQTLSDGRRIYYGHLASVSVEDYKNVKKGDKIGVMGSTGKSTGKHTHLEIRPKGTSTDSEDISAFTGIPNACGTYKYIPSVSKDYTVQNLIEDGITVDENAKYWEKVLAGKERPKAEYIRTLLDRYHVEIKKNV